MNQSENLESNQPLHRFRGSRKDNIQMNHKDTWCKYVAWINVEQKIQIGSASLHEHILYQHIHNP
jgi:hypothetical protein